MPRCRKCGNKLPFYLGWEFVCPQCGVRHPSIRTLTRWLAVFVVLLAVHSVMFLDTTSILDGTVVAALAIGIVLSSAQIIVLQIRRKGFGSGQFPAD